jgi:hypothetical protein
MFAILLALYILQLANAIQLNGAPRDAGAVTRQGGLAIFFFIFGIARSWQLVGARNISLATTVTAMMRLPVSHDRQLAQPGDAREGEGPLAAEPEPGAR